VPFKRSLPLPLELCLPKISSTLPLEFFLSNIFHSRIVALKDLISCTGILPFTRPQFFCQKFFHSNISFLAPEILPIKEFNSSTRNCAFQRLQSLHQNSCILKTSILPLEIVPSKDLNPCHRICAFLRS
jgi:hypothetical protein